MDLGTALRTGAWALQVARPYLFLAANVVSIAITASDIARGIAMIRRYRSLPWRRP